MGDRALIKPAKQSEKTDSGLYLPLQAQKGDLAIFLQRCAIEVLYEGEKYYCIPGLYFDAGRFIIDIRIMAGLPFDVLRTGKKYRFVNFGKTHDFIVENILGNGDFKVKHL